MTTLAKYIAAKRDLVYVAKQIGYITEYGDDNYIKTYGNLADK